jgi:uncharacterized protein (TIRG00374 family)
MPAARGEAEDAVSEKTMTSHPFSRRFSGAVRALFLLVPLGVAINVIVCLSTTDRKVLDAAANISPGYLAFAAILAVAPWFTDALRMLVWSRFFGRADAYTELLKVVIGAELGAAVVPPALGTVPVKVGLLMRLGFPGGTAFSLASLSSLEDWVFYLIAVPAAIAISASNEIPAVLGTFAVWRPGLLIAAGALVLLAAVLYALRWLRRKYVSPGRSGPGPRSGLREKIRNAARDFLGAWRLIARKGKSRFAATLALTAVQWICRYSVITVLLAGMGVEARPVLFFALQVVLFGLITVVPTPGGVGGAEAAFYLLYRPFIPAGLMGVVTAGWRFVTFYFLIVVALLAWTLFAGRSEKKSFWPRIHPVRDETITSNEVNTDLPGAVTSFIKK